MLNKASNIIHTQDVHTLDRDRLYNLIEHSFGRALINDNLFDSIHHFYIEENYKGVILLQKCELGLYLSKFTVDTHARGMGIAMKLWQQVVQVHPVFFWRCRITNPLSEWYQSMCDGYQHTKYWDVFWRGFLVEQSAPLIAFCVERKDDFGEKIHL